jgi:hypothetical protein
MTAIEKTDEEIWRAIRDLDPDQRRRTSGVACVIANSSCLRRMVLPDFRCLSVESWKRCGKTPENWSEPLN